MAIHGRQRIGSGHHCGYRVALLSCFEASAQNFSVARWPHTKRFRPDLHFALIKVGAKPFGAPPLGEEQSSARGCIKTGEVGGNFAVLSNVNGSFGVSRILALQI